MQPMSKVDPCHCHALRQAARTVTGFYDEALAPAGLRLSQFSMLVQLSDRKGIALGELAASLGLDRTTATRNLRLLERAGYVVIAAAEEDGRRKAISLTEAGRAVLREAFPLWQGAQAAFEDRHGGALVEQLRGTLRALESGRKTQTGD
jgi:DNA-binding MarR family transcriptional regulator